MIISKKKKGFTLVELMAVVAIIAILAAVLVPTVTGYINRSKKTAVIAQVRNLVSVAEIWNSSVTHTNPDFADGPIGLWDYVPEIVDKIEKGDPDIAIGDVSRIQMMSYDEAKIINADTNAMKNIKLDKDGNYLEMSIYDSLE